MGHKYRLVKVDVGNRGMCPCRCCPFADKPAEYRESGKEFLSAHMPVSGSTDWVKSLFSAYDDAEALENSIGNVCGFIVPSETLLKIGEKLDACIKLFNSFGEDEHNRVLGATIFLLDLSPEIGYISDFSMRELANLITEFSMKYPTREGDFVKFTFA